MDSFEIDKNTKCLIIASDGLFDVVEDQVNLYNNYIFQMLESNWSDKWLIRRISNEQDLGRACYS